MKQQSFKCKNFYFGRFANVSCRLKFWPIFSAEFFGAFATKLPEYLANFFLTNCLFPPHNICLNFFLCPLRNYCLFCVLDGYVLFLFHDCEFALLKKFVEKKSCQQTPFLSPGEKISGFRQCLIIGVLILIVILIRQKQRLRLRTRLRLGPHRLIHKLALERRLAAGF